MKTIYIEAKQKFSDCMSHNTNGGDYSVQQQASCSADNQFPLTGVSVLINPKNGNQASTYDSMERPFRYDRTRGNWSNLTDFYFACTSSAFGAVVSSEMPIYALLYGGVYYLLMYLLAIVMYAIPTFMMQTFMGQFSSSGVISAFRVAPLFKGFGYSIILLNLISLSYYTIIAAVPLIYAVNSLHSEIPWMHCNNAWNTPDCSNHTSFNDTEDYLPPHSTDEFFRFIISFSDESLPAYAISTSILCGVVGIWLLVLGILLKRIPFIGKFFRVTCVLLLASFVAVFVNLIINADIDFKTFSSYFESAFETPRLEAFMGTARTAALMATCLLGPGWGSVLNLASHNRFRGDNEKLTYWIGGTHIIVAILAMICGRIALDHYEDHVSYFRFNINISEEHFMQFVYLCFAYLFGGLTNVPNLWSFLFFGTLFLAEISAVIVQMMTVLTALFDEYEWLRKKKTQTTITLVVIMFIVSVYFCTKQGFEHLHVMPIIVGLANIIITLVLLIMITWIYGRERFQCDLQFMVSKTISSFKIMFLRFVTPAFMILCIIQILYTIKFQNTPVGLLIAFQCVIYNAAIGYMILKLSRTTGTWHNRLKQCFRPHDWYPVDATNRRFYEEIMGTSEMLVIDSPR